MKNKAGYVEALKLVLISLALMFALSAFVFILLKPDGGEAAYVVRTITLPDPPPPPPLIDPEKATEIMRRKERERLARLEMEELEERQKRADEAVAKLRAKYEKDGKLPEKIVLETPTSRPKPVDPDQEDTMPNTAPLVIHPHEKRVEFDAFVVLDKMGSYLPEVLISGPRGRVHETMLLTYINPYDFWQALALLGLKQSYTARWRADMVDLEGDRVIIEVQYKDKDGKSVRKRLEDFIYHFAKKSHMPYSGWVYTGSHFVTTRKGETFLVAQEVEEIATTWHWPQSIIDNPSKEAADDTIYCPYEGVVPPSGTELRVIITPDEKYNKTRAEAQPLFSKDRDW